MVVSLVFITDVLPAKGSMPVVAVLIVVYMCLMGMFLIVTVIVIKISSRKGHLPPLMKKIFLRYLARVVLLGDLTKRHRGHKLVNEDYLEMVNATKTNTSKPATPKTQMEILLCLGDTVRDLGRAVNKLAMSGSSKTGAEEDEVKTDYQNLARVLDRMCVALYIFGVILSIPIIRYSA
ncbi:uncharacterized protein LOC144920640 [Branchiostoma floridae x Branchiostoma belcheri]